MLTTRAPRLVGQRAADGVDGLEVAQHPAAAVQVGDRPARVLGRVDADADAARGGVLDVRDRRPLPRQVLGLGQMRRARLLHRHLVRGRAVVGRPRVEDLLELGVQAHRLMMRIRISSATTPRGERHERA